MRTVSASHAAGAAPAMMAVARDDAECGPYCSSARAQHWDTVTPPRGSAATSAHLADS